MPRSSVKKRFGIITFNLFGWAISSQLFRHCAATTVATEDPEHVMMIRALLGHSGITTSERHYNKSQMLHAGRRYNAALSQLRKNFRHLM